MASGNIALAALFKAFGPKKLKVQEYEEVVLKAAQSTNPAVKNAAYEFYKSWYYWQGEGILMRVEEKLKKAQVDDLKKLFEKVKEEIDAAGGKKIAVPTRTEAKRAAEDAKNAAIDAAMEEEKKEEEAAPDPLELAPELDVLEKYGPTWQEATNAEAKWQDKVAKIEELVTDCDKKKFKGNTEALVKFLNKYVANSNMNLAIAGTKAAAALSKNMKKDFLAGCVEMCGEVLKKYKEKRPMILTEVDKFVDAVPGCGNLDDFKE